MAIALAIAATGSCSGPGRQPSAAAQQSVDSPDDESWREQRWRHVSQLLRGRDISMAEWQRWTRQRTPAPEIADEMLADAFLSEVAAPAMLFRNNLYRLSRVLLLGGYALSQAEIGGRMVHYLVAKCAARDVVMVRPWWDLDTPIAVCRDAIRPTVWEARTAAGVVMPCDADPASPLLLKKTPCGCGPNLLRCAVPAAYRRIQLGALEEIRRTITHVIATDAPLAEMFVGNATVRPKIIELYYLRAIAEARRMADPEPLLRTADSWPAEGKLAARQELEPGQHAGLLTAPQILNHVFDPRQRQRIMFEVMWCAGESAPGALPEDVLSLHTANLSTLNEGWRELAARPICTHCHARLDYGMQFFRDYPVPAVGPLHYIGGKNRREQGPLYGSSIDDPRGTAELTAQGFARLATSQPEFARCASKAVAEYVFGPRIDAATIDRLAASAPPQALRYRTLMKAAVLEFVACTSCGVAGRDPPRAHAPATATFGALVDEYCSACHHDGAAVVNLEGALDPAIRARALDYVLFGRMPPTGALPWAVRRQFLAVAGSDGARDARGVDRSFLGAAADPPPALPLSAARQYIRQLVGQHGVGSLNTLEVALDGRDSLLTPNFAAITSIEAYRSCSAFTGEARHRCVERALDGTWKLSTSEAQ